MRRRLFVQPILFLAIFCLGRRMGMGRELTEQLAPVVEEYGNDGVKEAFYQAEQFSALLDAVQDLQSVFSQSSGTGNQTDKEAPTDAGQTDYRYLKPIQSVAGQEICNRLVGAL